MLHNRRPKVVAVIVAAACLALFAAGGCANRAERGAFVRSGWALGMGRGQSAIGVGPPGSDCTASDPICDTPCDAMACPGSATCRPFLTGRPKLLSRLLSRLRPALGTFLGHSSGRAAAGVAYDAGPSRFHPVPTQPVFARRDLPPGVGAGFGPAPFSPQDFGLVPGDGPLDELGQGASAPLRQPHSLVPRLDNVALLPLESRPR